MSQIITVTFAEGQREAIAAQPLEQWAYGQTLQFEGLDLPQAYRVDFSNFEYCGASIPRVGGPDGVAVPVEVLTSGLNVYAFIWIQDETSGARYRRATVRVVPGPEPDTDESPEEQSAVTEAINALNAAEQRIPAVVDLAVQRAIEQGDFSGAFWAVYGTTTGDEIDDALEAGKVVLLENSGLVFQLVGKLPTSPQNTFLFTTFTGDAYFALSVKGTTWSIVGQGAVAHLTSPNFVGTPTAPTAPAGTDNTQIATTEFVAAAIQAALEGFTPGQTISEELKQALLQLARKVAYIDAQGETYYQDLYDALYPPAVLASIRASFAQGSTVIYNTDSLDVLKPLLTVTAVYDDGSTETVPAADYTLSGTLATGVSTITASYQGKTATFDVVVTAAPMAFPVTNNLTGCSSSNSAAAVMENEPYSAVITSAVGYTLTGASVVITMAGSNITASAYSNGVINIARVTGALVISVAAVAVVLSSITAAYTQSGTVYDTDTLDTLKADLVVTATYSDGSTATVAAEDYTLSGTLTEGTSTITVSYGGKTTTFNVTVTEAPLLPTEYQQVEYIKSTGTQHIITDLMVETANNTSSNSVRLYTADIDFQFDEWQSSYATNIMAGFGATAGLWIGYANAVTNIAMGTSSGNYFSGDPTERHQYHWKSENGYGVWTRDDSASISRAFATSAFGERDFDLFYLKVASGTQNNFHFNGKLYSCKVFKSGVAVLDLYPCYRKNDGEIGLYDVVNNRFYTNNGSGTFLKGADVA